VVRTVEAAVLVAVVKGIVVKVVSVATSYYTPGARPITSEVIDRSSKSPDDAARMIVPVAPSTHFEESSMSNASAQPISTFSAPSSLLRKALLTDAVLTGLTGLTLAFAAEPLAVLLGLPAGLLRGSGVLLVPVAALVAWLGTRKRVYRPLVFAVIACNALWALDSILLLLSGWVEPTALGEVLTVGQALLVALLAELQFVGLRRSTFVESYARR
jgi:hypothetical protein